MGQIDYSALLNYAKLWGACFSGSAISYFYGSHTGTKAVKDKLRQIMPRKPDVSYERAAAIITVLGGTIGGMLAYAPDGPGHALAAGIAGPAAMMTLMGRKKKPKRKPRS
ncbi:hypothetical protein [Novacetimonas pomaceti]|uniref:hypothetical protein n=1 Tax=Novacetimonas pomaceti TaxID=2021998 RepID=UPI001C2DDF7A|nr:hypothetical protein [Novacetimonas pomaceti]